MNIANRYIYKVFVSLINYFFRPLPLIKEVEHTRKIGAKVGPKSGPEPFLVQFFLLFLAQKQKAKAGKGKGKTNGFDFLQVAHSLALILNDLIWTNGNRFWYPHTHTPDLNFVQFKFGFGWPRRISWRTQFVFGGFWLSQWPSQKERPVQRTSPTGPMERDQNPTTTTFGPRTKVVWCER